MRVKIDLNKRVTELSLAWAEEHPNATEDERKKALDEFAEQVVQEFMRELWRK